jgi:hypothetical protein
MLMPYVRRGVAQEFIHTCRSARLQRALKSKPGSDTTERRLVQHDGPTMQFGNIPDDRQPETRAWCGLVGADPVLEDPFTLIRIQARAIVIDSNHNCSTVIGRSDGDTPPRQSNRIEPECRMNAAFTSGSGRSR